MAEGKAIVPDYPSPAVSHDEHIGEKHEFIDEKPQAYAEHGPGIDHKIPQEGVIPAAPELAWSRIRRIMREPFAEFFGVFILILFGDG